jgi:hypothetical protein
VISKISSSFVLRSDISAAYFCLSSAGRAIKTARS